MRKTIIFVLLLCSGVMVAQDTFKLKDGKIVKSERKRKSNTVSPTFLKIDGVQFYKTNKGSFYYLRVSRKTGKTYKVYVCEDKD